MSDNKDFLNNLASNKSSQDVLGMFNENNENMPDIDFLFNKQEESDEFVKKDKFDNIKNTLTDNPSIVFKYRDYYQKALMGENETSQRFHKILSSYLNTNDAKERSEIRPRLISSYWNFTESIAKKISNDISEPKRYTLRFGSVLPNLMSPEQRNLLSKVILENNTGEPVHYVDEWLIKIANGEISPSASDEIKPSQAKKGENIKPQIEKHEGQKNAFMNLIKDKQVVISNAEKLLSERVEFLKPKFTHRVFQELKLPYDDNQKQYLNFIVQSVKDLQRKNKELSSLFFDLEKNINILDQLKLKNESLGNEVRVDQSVLVKEFSSIHQMAKMSVGRKGNHIPILMKQYFIADKLNIGTRENVINIAAMVEELDPGVFKRTFKRETNRIVPHFILLPCYGEKGICWEPFEKYNRGTSRGRIAIPMYPKDLKIAVISALADLRWQVSKEKGQHYWMEEGLTGHYYQWFSGKKMKGDVRERFILDYILWITKESEGTQKLDREVRGIFWRNIPFPENVRKDIRNRGFVYNELYKKDLNRLRSDGY